MKDYADVRRTDRLTLSEAKTGKDSAAEAGRPLPYYLTCDQRVDAVAADVPTFRPSARRQQTETGVAAKAGALPLVSRPAAIAMPPAVAAPAPRPPSAKDLVQDTARIEPAAPAPRPETVVQPVKAADPVAGPAPVQAQSEGPPQTSAPPQAQEAQAKAPQAPTQTQAAQTQTAPPVAEKPQAPETAAPETTGPETAATETTAKEMQAPPGGPPGQIIEGTTGPVTRKPDQGPPSDGSGNGKGGPPKFHKRKGPEDFDQSLRRGIAAVSRNMVSVVVLTFATNVLILAIPIYLFQISDRVLVSRSVDTLVMLTLVIVFAILLQSVFDAMRRFILMRTAVEVAVQLGAPVLSAAAHASLHGSGREYQTLGDLQQVRSFLTSSTLLSFLDVPFAPLFILAIFLVHPHLGLIVVVAALLLMVVALANQKLTSKPFATANMAQSKANMHLDSMSRNSQIINALAMIPEAVRIWGRDTANSLSAQVKAQDRNIMMSAVSRFIRLLTQVGLLGWGAFLAIDGEITGGMVIAASIIAGRALAPIEGAIEGWNAFSLSRSAYDRVSTLLRSSKLQYEKLVLPKPQGRLDVERLLFVPGGTKQVVLNGISFSLNPGETLAVIGNSGAGKTTLGKMLVGSVMPTSGNVRLDLMDLRNWDPRQFGESIGYLPQDVQLFPGTIKDNIGRMRADATDAQIFRAAELADVHEMIANLPQGYETVVAADGSPLSGGQKQRIALARAFYGEPRFVVLDEPNSNLDSNGDKALARAIEHARQNKITVVVITQKPSLLSVVDKIMLLADGGIQLFGERTRVLQELAGRKGPQAKQVR